MSVVSPEIDSLLGESSLHLKSLFDITPKSYSVASSAESEDEKSPLSVESNSELSINESTEKSDFLLLPASLSLISKSVQDRYKANQYNILKLKEEDEILKDQLAVYQEYKRLSTMLTDKTVPFSYMHDCLLYFNYLYYNSILIQPESKEIQVLSQKKAAPSPLSEIHDLIKKDQTPKKIEPVANEKKIEMKVSSTIHQYRTTNNPYKDFKIPTKKNEEAGEKKKFKSVKDYLQQGPNPYSAGTTENSSIPLLKKNSPKTPMEPQEEDVKETTMESLLQTLTSESSLKFTPTALISSKEIDDHHLNPPELVKNSNNDLVPKCLTIGNDGLSEQGDLNNYDVHYVYSVNTQSIDFNSSSSNILVNITFYEHLLEQMTRYMVNIFIPCFKNLKAIQQEIRIRQYSEEYIKSVLTEADGFLILMKNHSTLSIEYQEDLVRMRTTFDRAFSELVSSFN